MQFIEHEDYNQYLPSEDKVFKERSSGDIYEDLCVTKDKTILDIQRDYEEIPK